MSRCPACSVEVPNDAQFCGSCGFRTAPISRERIRHLSEILPPFKGPGARDEPGEGTPPQAAPLDETQEATGPTAGAVELSGRRFARYPLVVEVTVQSLHNFYRGLSHDISVGGLFIATEKPAEQGTEMELTFTVPGLSAPCRVFGVVRWVRTSGTDEQPAGMGVEFSDLTCDAQAVIHAFSEHREPLVLSR